MVRNIPDARSAQTTQASNLSPDSGRSGACCCSSCTLTVHLHHATCDIISITASHRHTQTHNAITPIFQLNHRQPVVLRHTQTHNAITPIFQLNHRQPVVLRHSACPIFFLYLFGTWLGQMKAFHTSPLTSSVHFHHQ